MSAVTLIFELTIKYQSPKVLSSISFLCFNVIFRLVTYDLVVLVYLHN